MTAGFVAAVLEGFEGTLDAVLERVGDGELRLEIESLQQHIAVRRRKFEERDALRAVPFSQDCPRAATFWQ